MDKFDEIILKIGFFLVSIVSILIVCAVIIGLYRQEYFEWLDESRSGVENVTLLFCMSTLFFSMRSILVSGYDRKIREIIKALSGLFVSSFLLLFFGWFYFLIVGNNEAFGKSLAYIPFLFWVIELFLFKCFMGRYTAFFRQKTGKFKKFS